ncbi:MAG: ribosome assembly cofactor RimP [Flavobacteriales bacterium]|nr:ribosome assembly cofactor RimP [Flavobacteriales bacterium]
MMITEAQITALVEERIADSDRFIVAVRVLAGNRIRVFVDGLSGVTVRDCVQISRHIEGSLDREVEDFELEVSTPGLTEPLTHPLQYVKNIGRSLKVETNEGVTVKGEVLTADAEQVTIMPEQKKLKKNEEQPGAVSIGLQQIKQAKTVISFN